MRWFKNAFFVRSHDPLSWLCILRYLKPPNITTNILSNWKLIYFLRLQIAFLFHNPFVAANQYRNIGRDGVGASDKMGSNCCDKNALMLEQMGLMNAVTIFTWHVILVGCLVVIIGVAENRRKHVYYKKIRHCCVWVAIKLA